PKAGDKGVKAASAKAYHKTKFPVAAAVELALGAYCLVGFIDYTSAEKYLVGPFLGLYAVGFLVVGVMSLAHYLRTRLPSREAQQENRALSEGRSKNASRLGSRIFCEIRIQKSEIRKEHKPGVP